ncbi:MAG TPA: hypothetical protein VFP71_08825, partial [Candidatus Angelobacter sp.]|nr:hypothetical protein [Candidatus Angelobacter sp.]
MKTFLGICIAVAVLLAAPTLKTALHAQEMQAVQQQISYEGQRVSSVQLAGQPDGNLRELRSL